MIIIHQAEKNPHSFPQSSIHERMLMIKNSLRNFSHQLLVQNFRSSSDKTHGILIIPEEFFNGYYDTEGRQKHYTEEAKEDILYSLGVLNENYPNITILTTVSWQHSNNTNFYRSLTKSNPRGLKVSIVTPNTVDFGSIDSVSQAEGIENLIVVFHEGKLVCPEQEWHGGVLRGALISSTFALSSSLNIKISDDKGLDDSTQSFANQITKQRVGRPNDRALRFTGQIESTRIHSNGRSIPHNGRTF